MGNDFKRGIRVYLETSDYGKGIEQMVAATKKYESSLEELTAESKRMTAAGENTGKKWDDLQKVMKRTADQVKKSQAVEADYRAKLQQTEKVLKNLSGTSYDELITVQKKLQKELKAATRGTEDHKVKLEQYNRVTKEVGVSQREMNSQLGSAEGGWSKAANGINKYMGMAMAGIAAITGLTMGLKKFMDMRMELEDSQANLKALTGLGDTDILWLTEQAKLLSTTTTETGVRITASSKEIMDGFTVINSKRPELLKNKEAMAEVTKQALILAATGVPVETAFDVVTASLNQFNLKSTDSNRIINAIAAGSLEGSAEADSLAGSLKNVGTVANGSNMTLEQTVAMLEVLASKQLLGEEAGTKLRGALLKMKDAGVGYVSGAFNVRDAIVEINQKMKDKSSAMERDALLQKVFGAENITAGQILLENVGAYDKLTVAVTGTNVALTQAQINTNTTSAKLKQAQNKLGELGMQLVEGLNPAMLSATNFTTNFLKILVQLPAWLKENWQWLAAATISIIAYTIAIKASAVGTALDIAWKKVQTMWTNRATIAQTALNFVVKANPIAFFVSLIALLVAGFITWYNSSVKVQAVTQGLFAAIKVIGGKLLNYWVGLWQIISGAATLDPKQMKKGIESLKNAFTGWGDEVGKAYTDAYNKRMKDAEKVPVKAKPKNSDGSPVNGDPSAAGGGSGGTGALTDEEKKKAKAAREARLKAALEALEAQMLKEQSILKQAKIDGLKNEEQYNTELLDLQVKYLKLKQGFYKKDSKDYLDLENQIQDIAIKRKIDGNAALLKVAQDTYKANAKSTDSFEKLEKTKLLDNFTTKEKYEADLLALEVTANERRVADAKIYAQQIGTLSFETEEAKKTNVEAAAAAIVTAEEKLALSVKAIADKKLADEKSFQDKKKAFRDKFGLDETTNLLKKYKKDLKDLKEARDKEWLTEKEYNEKKLELQGTTAEKYARQAVEFAGAVAEAISAYQQMETDGLEAEKQKQLTAAGNNAEQRQKIEQEFAQKELDLKKKQASATMAIQIAQAIAAGALAIANIWAVHAANPILAGILTALSAATSLFQIGSLIKQNAAIQATTLDTTSSSSASGSGNSSTGARVVNQAADGRWDVIGANDGKVYRNVPYRGVARTGIVSGPTLMAEQGDEAIIDNPTLRNIRMNAPWLLSEIKRLQVPQRAGGSYDAINNSSTAGGNSAGGSGSGNDTLTLAALAIIQKNSELLQYLIDNGVKAFMLLSDFDKQVLLRDKSLKKGSLK
ncbi:MAG TPA: phage tail tape measure protein [Paludibacter sp.]